MADEEREGRSQTTRPPRTAALHPAPLPSAKPGHRAAVVRERSACDSMACYERELPAATPPHALTQGELRAQNLRLRSPRPDRAPKSPQTPSSYVTRVCKDKRRFL